MPEYQGVEAAGTYAAPGALLAHAQSRHPGGQEETAEKEANFQLKQVQVNSSLAWHVSHMKDSQFHPNAVEIVYVLGFRPCGRNLVDFLGESLVVYPAAHHVVIFNTETNSMEFFHHAKGVKAVQCFHISPNREFIAVAEIHHNNASSPPLQQGGAGPGLAAISSSPAKSTPSTSLAVASHLHEQHQQHMLCIYKTASRNRVRSIPLSHNSSIVSCSFSACNKFLALLEDAPAHNVTYWKVSNAKLIASCKCPSRGARIHINPNNPSYISVSGPMVLKYWIWTNNEFKIGNFLPQLREQEHFVDHVWMKEYMVALSEKGLLLCFRATADYASVDLVHSYRCHHLSFVRMECITAHAKGFVLGGSAGFFSIYETSDDPKDPFALVRNVSVGDVAFESIAISPSIESIVVCTKSQELLTFAMSSIDTVQEDRVEYREFMRHGYQVGGVVQVDTCIQRPIIVSCGMDKSVRVWNYELRSYELLHQCSEEPQALGLHPCGFQVIVAFKERVRVYNILLESLKQVRELSTKSCRAIRYSRGGHLFACASGLTVIVFRSYTFEAVHTFSGHIGAVHCLTWSKDDFFLYSAAHDGAIYRWNITTGTRSEEMQHVVKQCRYEALVVDEKDPKVVVAGGSDGKVREITCGEETTLLDLAPGVHITSMALAKGNKRLFAGTNIGSILVYAWPLSANRGAAVIESFGHAEAITHMCITEDNESLVTCSEDGSICIFKISSFAGAVASSTGNVLGDGGVALDGSAGTHTMGESSSSVDLMKQQEKKKAMVAFVDSVLIARDDLEERHTALVELRQRYEQVKADVEFALHRKENEWIDRLRIVKEECETLVVQERLRYEELESRHQLAGRKHLEEFAQKEANHVKMTQELENQYERKLAQEIARYDALSETLEQTRQRCEALIESQDNQHRGTLHVERKASYARTKEQNEIIKRLHDDLKYNHIKFEEVLHQEETEYEQELQKVRAEYEKQLDIERQNTAIKQGQLSATNTKLESLKKKVQELKASSHARDVLFATEKAKTAKLESTLSHYEKHFETCKFSLADKDKAIQGLKSSNRVLENFRSVLHHRIDNLEVEKAPMQDHMKHLETHIADMQNELFDEFKIKAAIDKEIESKDAKVKMLLHEVKMLRQSTLKKEYSMSEMTRELTRLAQITNLKEMEAAVKDAYKTFVIGEHVHKKPPKAMIMTQLAGSRQDELSADNNNNSSNNNNNSSPAKRGGTPQQGRASATAAPSPAKGKNGRQDTPSKELQQQQQNKGGTSSAATDEALGYDCKQAVDESVKQMEYMSRTIQALRNALENTKLKVDRIRRDSVAEGSILIDECNKLRKENKRLLMKIRELEHAMSAASGSFGNYSASTSGMKSPFESAGTPGKEMHASFSCPEIITPLRLAPESEFLSLDTCAINNTTSSKLLMPLSSTSLSKQKQQQQRKQPGVSSPASPSPSSSLSSRHGGTGNNMLPFARLELEREKRSGRVSKVDEMAQLVERQKKEIQRLQRQVQFLLAAEEPNELQFSSRGGNVSTASTMTSRVGTPSAKESTLFSSSASASTDLSRGSPIVSARTGVLRPIHLQAAVPLDSSFTLTPSEQLSSSAVSSSPSSGDGP